MWICLDCNTEFEEPSTYQEYMGEFWGTPAYETFCCCPFCESDEIEEKEEPEEEDD